MPAKEPDVERLLSQSSFLMKKQRYLAERVRYLTSDDVEEHADLL